MLEFRYHASYLEIVIRLQLMVEVLRFESFSPKSEPEVLDGLCADGELDGGADRPQLEELRRELVAHEATHVRVVAVRGDVRLQAGLTVDINHWI